MTEPTQEQINAALTWLKQSGSELDPINIGKKYIGHWFSNTAAAYTNHKTAKMQAKIDRLEIVNEDLRKTVCNTLNDYIENTEVKSLLNRIATLEAELASRDFVPISEADWHEDIGPVLWWKFPIEEPPYSGSPLDADWPGDHTHFTRIPLPQPPKETK